MNTKYRITKTTGRCIFSMMTGILLLAGCRSSAQLPAGETDPMKMNLTVASETRIGYGVAPQKCMLIKYAPEEKWQYMYSGIEGFDYEPGYEYQLEVQRTERTNPPQDASKYVYRLKKVKSKVKMQSAGLPSDNR